VRVWRLTKANYAASSLDGEGARRHGGRWNSPGCRVVYTAQSLALATVELLAHISAKQARRIAFASVEIDVPEPMAIAELDPLPPDWQAVPAPPSTIAAGDAWLATGRQAILRVPSVIVPSEYNYLLNPQHADFAAIALVRTAPFTFDVRLAT
jgi:RES domain-containing protein